MLFCFSVDFTTYLRENLMWYGISIVCEVIVACWLLGYLFNKFDPNGEIRASLHQLIVSLLTRWTKNDRQAGG